MKCLEITLIPPDMSSGGGLGVYQSVKSLSACCVVDYIGPQYDEKIFEDCANSVNKFKILSMNRAGILKSIYRLIFKGITTSFYDSWLDIKNIIDWDKYDFVHVEFSRYKFIVDESHKHNKKCIIREHNVESDYAQVIYNLSHRISDYIRYKSFRINEKAVLISADLIIFITEKDIKRAKHLYSFDINKAALNPVCIDVREKIALVSSTKPLGEEKVILMTGSLGHGPNVNGIIWFVDNVWNKIEKSVEILNINLVIAGRNPSKNIKDIVKSHKRISLIDSPPNMEPFFMNADIYVAAVFDGAGMKVKVAEAMSYGLPVVGTQHAFIGYESINHGKYLANKAEEFIEAITTLANIDDYHVMRKEILSDFKNSLSMDSSILRYKEIIKDVLQ